LKNFKKDVFDEAQRNGEIKLFLKRCWAFSPSSSQIGARLSELIEAKKII